MSHDVEEIIKLRKAKLTKFFKAKTDWIVYILLAFITFIALRIRTRNLSGLRDVTTGGWTLGPDLDPFLFLRYAKEIVETGTLSAVDMMRYVPLGFDTLRGFKLHYYLIAWFHKVAIFFGSESVEQSAALFPVFAFGLTVIAFFLLSRQIFFKLFGSKKANFIAIVSTFFFSVFPVFLPRTIAGIPEKESIAFFFMFMTFYLFIASWQAEKLRNKYSLGILAGLFTGFMALIWGGYGYIFMVIAPSVFLAFLLNKVDKPQIYTYILWLFTALIIMTNFSGRYSIIIAIKSLEYLLGISVFVVIILDKVIYKTNIKKYFLNGKIKNIPPRIISSIISVVLLVFLAVVFLGPSFVVSQINGIYDGLFRPATSRLIQTVAENRQPYFTEWVRNFGPAIKSLQLTFWLAMIGSVSLFNKALKNLRKKERLILSGLFALFITTLTFSRYSPGSLFDGQNFISKGVFFLGGALFLGFLGIYYYRRYVKSEMEDLKKIDFGAILFFEFLILSIISARGFIRLVMMLVIPFSIILGYISMVSFYKIKGKFEENNIFQKIISGIVILMIVFSGYSLFKTSDSMAQNYVPSIYTNQWQRAMFWVRENTPGNAVFGHWWDYGYWIQTIGERATILDGGNVLGYWNYLMGRYGLTETNFDKTLNFLYAHNTTHFLIDSTDIGKYTAFSSIGSDGSYDRRSWIPTFLRDESQTTEMKNSIIEIYPGGSTIDEDIVYVLKGNQIFLPSEKTGLGAIIIRRNLDDEILELEGVFVYQGKQYILPLKYFYEKELIDLGKGIEAGIFLYPRIDSRPNGNIDVVDNGALLYLSGRTVESFLAKKYLYGESDPNFLEAHVESDFLVEHLRNQNVEIGEFVYYQGFKGPIKIWEIKYPETIIFKKEFLETDYPEDIRIG